MSDIDDVIRRSREPGQFSERKEFTIAKDRGIQKMRKFALKTSSHYILELIQGAVANGATYVDIQVDSQTTRVAWTGGVFRLEELQQIFDFLFSDNQDPKYASIRQLAVGVSGLLAFKPKQIVIESGDGTLENSSRIEIDPQSMQIVAGRPTSPIEGTFILAEKKKGECNEDELIAERCLTLNIPIIVNDRVLFGYASIRSPDLFGVKKSAKFDEGNFYGTIGLSRGSNTDTFKILTHGVWIQSLKKDLGTIQRFGGIIAFDNLNKTVDYSSIVEDHVWDEMWARVSLLARDLISQTGTNTKLLLVDGEWTDISVCRKIVTEAGGAILFRQSLSLNASLVLEFEKFYQLPSFIVRDSHIDLVRELLSSQTIHIANGTEEELENLKRPKTSKPKGPFFLPPIRVAGFDLVPGVEIISLKIYTPRISSITKVEFVESEIVTDAYDLLTYGMGFHISVQYEINDETYELPNLSSEFHTDLNIKNKKSHFNIGSAIAIIERLSETLQNTSIEIANDYASVIGPRTTGALHVLKALSSTTIFSIDNERFSIRRFGQETNAILNIPILKTLEGRPVSVVDIVNLMNTQFGLVYGSVENVYSEVAQLDKSKILSLTLREENEVRSIFGDAAYIRVDDRDILATHVDSAGRTFAIRDMAIGLRNDEAYICCEDSKDISIETAGILVDQLKRHVRETKFKLELRRQSLRHLVWILTHENTPLPITKRLENFPLFRDHEDRIISYDQLTDHIEMLDGWSLGPIALPKRNTTFKGKNNLLALNAFVFHMLLRKKKLSAQSGSHGNRTDLRASLLSVWIDAPDKRGTICLMPRRITKTFSVIDPTSKRVFVQDWMAEKLMCAGEIFSDKDDRFVDTFLHNSIKLFGKAAKLIERSDDLNEIHRIAESAFFGSVSLIVVERIGDFLRFNTKFPDVEHLLECRVFKTKRGIPISAKAIVQHFESPIDALDDNPPDYQVEWLETIIEQSEIVSESKSRTTTKPKAGKIIYFLVSQRRFESGTGTSSNRPRDILYFPL